MPQSAMELEVHIAVDFLISFMTKSLSSIKSEALRLSLCKAIIARFRGHWYPDRPNKGSGFRCISISDQFDQVLFGATKEANIDGRLLEGALPKRLDLWIDPGEVAYRIGEQGSVKMIYKHGNDSVNNNSIHYRAIVTSCQSKYLAPSPNNRGSAEESHGQNGSVSKIGQEKSPGSSSNRKHKENYRLSPTAKSFSSRRSPTPFLCPVPSAGLLPSSVVTCSDYQGNKSYWATAYDPLGLTAHNYLLAQELALYEAQRIALQSQYYKSSYFQWLRRHAASHTSFPVAGQQSTTTGSHQRSSQLPIVA